MQALAWNEIINELTWKLDAVHDFETRFKITAKTAYGASSWPAATKAELSQEE